MMLVQIVGETDEGYNEEYNLCNRMVGLYRKHKDKKELLGRNFRSKVASLLEEASIEINAVYNNTILQKSIHPNTLVRFLDLSQYISSRDLDTILNDYWEIAQDPKRGCEMKHNVQAQILKTLDHVINGSRYKTFIAKVKNRYDVHLKTEN